MISSSLISRAGAMGLVFSGLALLGGCSSAPVAFDYRQEAGMAAGEPMVWPAPPERPRYRFAGVLTGEENLVVPGRESRSAISRAFRWLVGMEEYGETPVVLQRPQSGVVDGEGRILVTDVSRQGVYVFDPARARLDVWEFAGEQVRFELPIGITVKGDSVLVADASLGYVAVLGADGTPRGRLGEQELGHPTGVVWSEEAGRLFVADRKANQVKVFDEGGALLFSIGEFGERPGQLNGPTYLAWHAGELYVTDTLNSRIQVFSADGEFLRGFGRRGLYVGDLPRPKGVAVDRDGNVYVVESYYDHLLVFDGNGQFLLPIGGSGSAIGQFYLPAGVWTDIHDRVYVADMFNGRVVIFEYLGDGDESDVAEDHSAYIGRADRSH